MLLVIAVLVGCADLAYADFDRGKAAYDGGDYGKAREEFKTLAAKGTVNGV
jgi:hypothetical protein